MGNMGGVKNYVGEGIGGKRVKWRDIVDIKQGFQKEGDEKWRLKYEIMEGDQVDIKNNIKIDEGYRYSNVKGGKMFEGNKWNDDGYEKGMNINDIRVGIS